MRRRTALTAAVVTGVAILLVSYVWYAQSVVRDLQREAERATRMFASVWTGLTTLDDGERLNALADLMILVRETGVPMVVTNERGTPIDSANVPFTAPFDDPQWADYVRELDAASAPVTARGAPITVHFGTTLLVRGLRVIPMLQAGSVALLLLALLILLRLHNRAERERLWAGMARESAHQLGTPLSSLHGWMDVLSERAGDPLLDATLNHMRGDLERLERVAHRFERIGRPTRRESVDVAALVQGVVDYFRARVPTLATPVRFAVDVHGNGLTVPGDRVLLEWVVESLVKNAVDALSGTGGTITVEAEAVPGGRVRLRVSDDGPGVPQALRRRIFDAGFSTKERGWGIGLALTRRIVEENHGGRILLVPTPKGATFDVILRA